MFFTCVSPIGLSILGESKVWKHLFQFLAAFSPRYYNSYYTLCVIKQLYLDFLIYTMSKIFCSVTSERERNAAKKLTTFVSTTLTHS